MANKAILLEFKGRKQTIRQWAEETGIPRSIIYQRISRLGWSVDQALGQARRKYSRTSKAPITLAKAA